MATFSSMKKKYSAKDEKERKEISKKTRLKKKELVDLLVFRCFFKKSIFYAIRQDMYTASQDTRYDSLSASDVKIIHETNVDKRISLKDNNLSLSKLYKEKGKHNLIFIDIECNSLIKYDENILATVYSLIHKSDIKEKSREVVDSLVRIIEENIDWEAAQQEIKKCISINKFKKIKNIDNLKPIIANPKKIDSSSPMERIDSIVKKTAHPRIFPDLTKAFENQSVNNVVAEEETNMDFSNYFDNYMNNSVQVTENRPIQKYQIESTARRPSAYGEPIVHARARRSMTTSDEEARARATINNPYGNPRVR